MDGSGLVVGPVMRTDSGEKGLAAGGSGEDRGEASGVDVSFESRGRGTGVSDCRFETGVVFCCRSVKTASGTIDRRSVVASLSCPTASTPLPPFTFSSVSLPPPTSSFTVHKGNALAYRRT